MDFIVARRRRLIVAAFQKHLFAVNMVYSGALLLIVAGVVFGIPGLMPGFSDVLAGRERLALHLRVWPAVGLVLALFALHTVALTHRFAGPLYRFRKVLERVTEGDLEARANLRDGDYLQEEAALLNAMLDGFSERFCRATLEAEEFRRVIASLRTAAEEARLADLRAEAKDAQRALDELCDALRQP